MNKFEQEVEGIIERGQRYDEILSAISSLHDNEMIEFAEWVENNYTIEDNSNPVRIWGTVFSDQTYTTSELLTIFRNQQK